MLGGKSTATFCRAYSRGSSCNGPGRDEQHVESFRAQFESKLLRIVADRVFRGREAPEVPRRAVLPASDPMFTRCPRHFSRWGMALRVQRTRAMKFRFIIASNSSAVTSMKLRRAPNVRHR